MVDFIQIKVKQYIEEKEKFYIKENNPNNRDNSFTFKVCNFIFMNLFIIYIIVQAYSVESFMTFELRAIVFEIIVSRNFVNFLLTYRFIKNFVFETSEKLSTKIFFILLGFCNLSFNLLIFCLAIYKVNRIGFFIDIIIKILF